MAHASRKNKLKKGIILAGGLGTRLYPITQVANKQLLPIYDKPVIYYPLTTLMLSGVTDVLVISSPRDLPALERFLGDGSQWGMNISYAEQEHPKGIAEGILIGEEFIDGDPFSLILGDNIFYGRNFSRLLKEAANKTDEKANIFTFWVSNPKAYGVLEIDKKNKPVALIEKPENPKSNLAVTGLYFYDNRAVEYTKSLAPSARGELEITDLNKIYLEEGKLEYTHLGRGFVWFDAGTTQNLLTASQLVEIMQTRQRTGIAFPEELALRQGMISYDFFCDLVSNMPQCAYQAYLKDLQMELKDRY